MEEDADALELEFINPLASGISRVTWYVSLEIHGAHAKKMQLTLHGTKEFSSVANYGHETNTKATLESMDLIKTTLNYIVIKT